MLFKFDGQLLEVLLMLNAKREKMSAMDGGAVAKIFSVIESEGESSDSDREVLF